MTRDRAGATGGSGESTTDRGERGDGRSRRAFLRRGAAGAALVGGLAAARPTVARTDYGSVVDVVEDFGADPTGEEAIDDALDDAIDDDTEVVFPDGEYWIEGSVARTRTDEGEGGVSDLALVGEGDARIRPTPDTNPTLLRLEGTGIHVENVTFDQTADRTSLGIRVLADDDLVIRDVLFEGAADGPGGPTDDYGDNGERHGPFNMVPGVTGQDGTGIVENVHSPDGTVPYYRKGGAWVANEHYGHLVFRRCSFEEFSDNAIYASGAGVPGRGWGGSVGIENCFFRNNNTSSIRLGTSGSYAKNCTVVFEEGAIPEVPWGAVTGRAAWLWYGFDGTLENIDVVSDHERGVGFYDRDGDRKERPDEITVSNCRFEMNAGAAPAVRFASGGDPVTLRGVSVTGAAESGAAIEVAERDLTVEGLCLHQTGSGRDGISVGTNAVSLANAVVDVPRRPIVAEDTSGHTYTGVGADAGEAGECPPPDPAHDYEAASEFSLPTPGSSALTPRPTATPTPGRPQGSFSDDTESPTPTATSTASATPSRTPSSTSTAEAPGLTSLAAAGALGAAALAALRRTDDDE